MDKSIALKTEAPLTSTGLPGSLAWEKATRVSFCSDWRGEQAAPQRETQARFLWSDEFLFVQALTDFSVPLTAQTKISIQLTKLG